MLACVSSRSAICSEQSTPTFICWDARLVDIKTHSTQLEMHFDLVACLFVLEFTGQIGQ